MTMKSGTERTCCNAHAGDEVVDDRPDGRFGL